MKHLLGRVWTPVFATIDLKRTTLKIKDGSVGVPVSVAGGGTDWTESVAQPGEFHYGGASIPTKPVYVELHGVDITANEGVLGSLSAGEWAWGDNDTLGSDTMYIRLSAGADPDAMVVDALKVSLTQTPNEIEIKIGEGNLTYTETRNIDYILDRGILDDVREGDEAPMDVNFDFQWEYISGLPGSAIPTIEEALKKTGEAADWNSVDSDQCRPYAVDIEITYEPIPASCGDKEIITLPHYRWATLDHDLRGGTVASTGQCNKTEATAVRSAQT